MTNTSKPRIALSKQQLQEVILAKLDEFINAEISQIPEDYSVQEIAGEVIRNATQASSDAGTEEKVFSVGFSYSEQGSIYIKATSPEAAEEKLFQLLADEGLERLSSRHACKQKDELNSFRQNKLNRFRQDELNTLGKSPTLVYIYTKSRENEELSNPTCDVIPDISHRI